MVDHVETRKVVEMLLGFTFSTQARDCPIVAHSLHISLLTCCCLLIVERACRIWRLPLLRRLDVYFPRLLSKHNFNLNLNHLSSEPQLRLHSFAVSISRPQHSIRHPRSALNIRLTSTSILLLQPRKNTSQFGLVILHSFSGLVQRICTTLRRRIVLKADII